MLEEPIVEWRSLSHIGFSNYSASIYGHVANITTGYYSYGSVKKAGWCSSTIIDDQKRSRTIATHILVAKAFLGVPTDPTLTVDHIDRNRTNNHISNLRWATKSEQAENQNAIKGIGRKTGKAVTQIAVDGTEIATWFRACDAIEYAEGWEISHSCKTGKSVKGYYWKYARDNLPGEIWQQLKDDKFKYQIWVSNRGRIFTSNGTLTFGHTNDDGYRIIGLKTVKGHFSCHLVHRLVMRVFQGHDGRMVNHKDSNRRNNKLENLEYVTAKENAVHAIQSGKVVRPNTHRMKPVRQLTMDGKIIAEYRSGADAARATGILAKRIASVCMGDKGSTGGFKWEHIK